MKKRPAFDSKKLLMYFCSSIWYLHIQNTQYNVQHQPHGTECMRYIVNLHVQFIILLLLLYPLAFLIDLLLMSYIFIITNSWFLARITRGKGDWNICCNRLRFLLILLKVLNLNQKGSQEEGRFSYVIIFVF